MSMNFGIAHVPRSGSEWVRTAQSAEQQGYGTLLLPDTLYTPSPFPALAAAAAVTTTLHLRPNVIAAPLRTPAVIARETSALQLLSDGRFELGLGTGRPDAAREAESSVSPGVPPPSAGAGSSKRSKPYVRRCAPPRRSLSPPPVPKPW